MAARRTPPQKPERPPQTAEQKKRCIDKINARIADLTAFDPATIQQEHGDPQVKALQVSIETALATSFGQGTSEYNRYSQAAFLDRAAIRMNSRSSWIDARGGYSDDNRNDLREAVHAITKAKAASLALLGEAVKALEEEIEDMQFLPPIISPTPSEPKQSRQQMPHIHISGENSRVNINSHDQSVNMVNFESSDFAILASELSQLRQALAAQAKSAQDHVTIGTIANAELAAEEQNSSKISSVLSGLGTAGHWALKVARDLGIAVAAKAIEAHL